MDEDENSQPPSINTAPVDDQDPGPMAQSRAAYATGDDPEAETMPVQKAMPTRTPTGFERFLEHGLAMAGQRRGSGSDRKTGAVFGDGWAKGLSRGQAIEKARAMYAALPDQNRKRWESEASLTDVRSGREVARETQYRSDRAAALGIGTVAPGAIPVAKSPTPGGGTGPVPPRVGPPTSQPAPIQAVGRGAINGKPTETVLGNAPKPGTIAYAKPDGSQWRTSGQDIREGFDPVRVSPLPAAQPVAQPAVQPAAPSENKYMAGQGQSLGSMLDRVHSAGTMRKPQMGGPLRQPASRPSPLRNPPRRAPLRN